MPVPEYLAKHYEKTSVELTLEDVIRNSEGVPETSQINRVKTIARVQAGIDKYRAEAKTMSKSQLQTEKHDSKRLGIFLDALVKSRPPRCQAHAIISGLHPLAIDLRIVMAACGMRIDDVLNGCWLPENTKACPHPVYPKAPPHSRIHRKTYYIWLASMINKYNCKHINVLRTKLKLITQMLHQHNFPENILKLEESV